MRVADEIIVNSNIKISPKKFEWELCNAHEYQKKTTAPNYSAHYNLFHAIICVSVEIQLK